MIPTRSLPSATGVGGRVSGSMEFSTVPTMIASFTTAIITLPAARFATISSTWRLGVFLGGRRIRRRNGDQTQNADSADRGGTQEVAPTQSPTTGPGASWRPPALNLPQREAGSILCTLRAISSKITAELTYILNCHR